MPPPARRKPMALDAVLAELHRRRMIVSDLIQSLEQYSDIQHLHKTHVPLVAVEMSNYYVN